MSVCAGVSVQREAAALVLKKKTPQIGLHGQNSQALTPVWGMSKKHLTGDAQPKTSGISQFCAMIWSLPSRNSQVGEEHGGLVGVYCEEAWS